MIKVLFIVAIVFSGFLTQAASEADCSRAREEFKDSQQLPGSPIFFGSIGHNSKLGCFVELTFFGNRNLLDFVDYRLKLGLRPDQELVKSTPVQLFLNTPTVMQDIYIGDDGVALDPQPQITDCQQAVDQLGKLLHSADIAMEVFGADLKNCRLEVKFKDLRSYRIFLTERFSSVGDTLLDKFAVHRSGTADTFVIFVPLWYSVK